MVPSRMSCEFPCREAPYSNIFVLKLVVTVNGQPMNMRFSEGHLEICVESLSSGTVALSMDSVARDVQRCLRSCGYGIVCKEMYRDESAPLFQVLATVPSFEAMFLKEFVAQLPHFSQQLQLALQEKLSNSSAIEDVSCEVKTEVYLITRDTANRDRILVSDDNVDHCMDLWKKSATFCFDHVHNITEDDAQIDYILNNDRQNDIVQPDMGVEMTLQQLQKELKDVVDWLNFGVGLGIEGPELLTIENDHRNQTDRCKTQVLIVWMRRKRGSWSDVVNALWAIGMEKLAKEITEKYRVTGHVAELDSSAAVNDSLKAAECMVYLSREDGRRFLREKKELEKERDSLKKRAEDLERELFELKLKEKRDEHTIAKKEEDLGQARKALEEAEDKIKKHEVREEAARKQLEVADRELNLRTSIIRTMEKEKKELRADLEFHKMMAKTLAEKIPLYSTPDTRVSVEHEFTAKLKAEEEKIKALTQRLTEDNKSLAGLKHQIVQLQSRMDLDLAIQVRLSQLREKVSKKEKERDEVDVQLTTSSKVAQAIEKAPTELKALCDRLPSKLSTSTNTAFTQTESCEVPVILRLRLLDSGDDD